MGIDGGLYISDVAHKRLRPKVNSFCYKVYYLCFPLSQIDQLSNRFLKRNKPWLYSFYDKDHGARDGSSLKPWIEGVLTKFGVTKADGEVILITMPRLFGYGFNPVSFWFCHSKSGELKAVLAEVRNTFGQHHSYLIAHPNQRTITHSDWFESQKCFHVSPFMHVEGTYFFRFDMREDKLGIWINYETKEGKLLNTSMTGKRIPLTNGNLMRCFTKYPLVTFKVIGLIHYQALKLIMKRIPYVPKPKLPDQEITR